MQMGMRWGVVPLGEGALAEKLSICMPGVLTALIFLEPTLPGSHSPLGEECCCSAGVMWPCDFGRSLLHGLQLGHGERATLVEFGGYCILGGKVGWRDWAAHVEDARLTSGTLFLVLLDDGCGALPHHESLMVVLAEQRTERRDDDDTTHNGGKTTNSKDFR
ncbi:hypothetical protein GOP47_0019548 [Adiantum capillus-veneris]|uniref:Uncharacterized protein n=1 Tax=Adiantum capillus-veneris TaxID=13818 RepID=A0A9D4Z761_ADICA|nr:hypothetical protein GOP47_0019548 [Adiantum capillus-veneris]